MTELSIHTEFLPKRTTECREKDRERLAQKPCAFDVMKDARAARSMYQSILLRQFMKFLVSCRPFARHRRQLSGGIIGSDDAVNRLTTARLIVGYADLR